MTHILHPQQEDDWELDINFGSNTTKSSFHHNHNIFQRKGAYTMGSDKELDLACERYQYPSHHYYLEDDDTNSSVTSGSVLSQSGKYSEIDISLHDIDDFMFDEPPPASMSSSVIVSSAPALTSATTAAMQQYDFSQFSGVVKKLVGPNSRALYKQEMQDSDDWNDDIEMPTKLSTPNVSKIYDQQLLSLDDDEDDNNSNEQLHNTTIPTRPPFSDIGASSSMSPPSTRTVARNFYRYEPEKDEEDDDMSGLDFPENMSLLPKRLDEKKKYNPSIVQPPTSNNATTRIPVSKTSLAHKSKFLLAQRETDDDEFCDGLNIKDKAFSFSQPSTSTTCSSPKQFLQERKGKESSHHFISRLARPSPLINNGNKQSDHAIALAKRTTKTPATTLSQQQRQKISNISAPALGNTKHTFLAGTKASRQREADIAARKSKASMNGSGRTAGSLVMNKSLLTSRNTTESSIVEKKSATGYTLIARPKTKTTTYCSRIDNIDNLNDFDSRPTASSFVRGYQSKRSVRNNIASQPHPRSETKTDPDRPWRKNMQTSLTSGNRSKIKLIQLSEQNLRKEYNDMRYDDTTHCWKGNEKSLLGFEDKPTFRRPMLISSRQRKNAPSRYAAVVGSSMIFNTEKQKWISANGPVEECNELDDIEDLKDELLNTPQASRSSHHVYPSNRVNNEKLLDFKLSVEVKRQMMYEQEQHESWMANWPLNFNNRRHHF